MNGPCGWIDKPPVRHRIALTEPLYQRCANFWNLERLKERGETTMSDRKKHSCASNIVGSFVALIVTLFLQTPTASAIPSYARQTGFPCKSCHYMPPELTPLGRAFKLNCYTMAGKPTVTSPGKGNVSGLNILESFPLSVLFDTSFTSLKSPQAVPQMSGPPAPAQNGSF